MPSFWDMQKRLAERRRSSRGASPSPPGAQDPASALTKPLTVTQFSARINKVLKQALPAEFIVRGEVSEWTIAASGHRYFCLKDARNSLQCVMWQSDAAFLKFEPQVGQEVIATGFVDSYGVRSEYQLKCHRLEPVGQGARDLALRQLLERLDREGLFDPERKKPLPTCPLRIAIVTSAAAAGYQDVLKVFRSFRFLKLFHYTVPVQGEGAAEKIAEALAHLNARQSDIGGIDVVMLVRGGGSSEDLWCFNEEPVARAIAAMSVPVITGIGHQTDRCVADMVADYEAHTPTEAAQVLVRNWKAARDRVEQLGTILRRDLRRHHDRRRKDLLALARHELFRRPAEIIHRQRRKIDEVGFALSRALRQLARRTSQKLRAFSATLERAHPRQRLTFDRRRLMELDSRLRRAQKRLHAARRETLSGIARHLEALGPSSVLRRGYSITILRRTGGILRVAEARPGDTLVTRAADGEVQSTLVGPATQGNLFE